jgi:hypothetical protein
MLQQSATVLHGFFTVSANLARPFGLLSMQERSRAASLKLKLTEREVLTPKAYRDKFLVAKQTANSDS